MSDVYEIIIRGRISERWAAWLPGMEMRPLPGGRTMLVGTVTDQAALHAILERIRDLNLPLIHIDRREPGGLGKENT